MLRVINEYQITIDSRDWVFNRRNVNRLAKEYDANVTYWQPEIEHSVIKDNRDRILLIEGNKPYRR